MPVSCDPQALIDSSRCIDSCVPPGMQTSIQTYLLAMIAGVNPDPQALIDAARCMECIPPGMQIEVQNYLLCQILNS